MVITPPFAPQAWQNGRLFRLMRLLRLVRVGALRRLLSLEGMKTDGQAMKQARHEDRRILRMASEAGREPAPSRCGSRFRPLPAYCAFEIAADFITAATVETFMASPPFLTSGLR